MRPEAEVLTQSSQRESNPPDIHRDRVVATPSSPYEVVRRKREAVHTSTSGDHPASVCFVCYPAVLQAEESRTHLADTYS